MHLKFGHLIPGMWRTPMRVGRMRMLRMGGVNILRVGLRVLPLDELRQCVELVLEGFLEFLADLGDQILLKNQNVRNRFKIDTYIGLILMIPTQLERVQMDVL
jgi:hypothetical protein